MHSYAYTHGSPGGQWQRKSEMPVHMAGIVHIRTSDTLNLTLTQTLI